MQHADFVSVYPKSHDSTRLDQELGPYSGLLHEANDWSRRFGRALIDHLQDEQSTTKLTESDLGEHRLWVAREGSAIEETLSAEQNYNNLQALNALMVYNFHPVAAAMSPMWAPIVGTGWQSEQERQSKIRISQAALAIKGVSLFAKKIDVIAYMQSLGKDYFEEENRDPRGYYEGILNEIDTGVTSLSIAVKMPDSTVVPAPLQFEQNSEDSQQQYNADYLLIDPDSVIGIQAKSLVTDIEHLNYDRSRIVPVDCSTDLGNQFPGHRHRFKSQLLPVAYGGPISAHHVLSLPTSGRAVRELASAGIKPREISRAQSLARSALNGMKSMNYEGVKIIGDRIQKALAYNK